MVLVILSVVGCSNKELYNKLRLDQRNKCVEESQRTLSECIEHTNKSYEEYEHERKEISNY